MTVVFWCWVKWGVISGKQYWEMRKCPLSYKKQWWMIRNIYLSNKFIEDDVGMEYIWLIDHLEKVIFQKQNLFFGGWGLLSGIFLFFFYFKLSVVCAFNLSTQETEAEARGSLWVGGQLGLYRGLQVSQSYIVRFSLTKKEKRKEGRKEGRNSLQLNILNAFL